MSQSQQEFDELNKAEWVKVTVLEDMLLDIEGYTNEGLDMGEEKENGGVMVTSTNSEESSGSTAIPPNGKRALFTIAPVTNGGCTEGERSSPMDIVIGLHGSDSSPKLQSNGMRSRNSGEFLIPEEEKERWYAIAAQVCIPFLVAGFGMVAAGIILDIVKNWPVFRKVPELLVLVTPLLGLKGNLEMTLASRLSTHSNLGHMDTARSQWHICCGNLALTQVQAIVVGLFASMVAMIIGAAFKRAFLIDHAILLCTCSILTASIASCILGFLMVAVVILSKKFNLNPDNIATPIAASLGDVTTLGLLAWLASILFEVMDSMLWLSPCIILAYILITPLWILISYKNSYTQKILYSGWAPVLWAMLISSGGGLMLDMAESQFPRIALFQPVINGVGGNLVSVQASRISTSLHKYCQPGKLPDSKSGDATVSIWITPWNAFTKQGVHSVSARVLLAIVVPGHIIFCFTSSALSNDGNVSQLSLQFFIVYLTAAIIQVSILLYMAQVMINCFWIRKSDPDTSAIPYLTAVGDLLGTGLLFLTFKIVYWKW